MDRIFASPDLSARAGGYEYEAARAAGSDHAPFTGSTSTTRKPDSRKVAAVTGRVPAPIAPTLPLPRTLTVAMFGRGTHRNRPSEAPPDGIHA